MDFEIVRSHRYKHVFPLVRARTDQHKLVPFDVSEQYRLELGVGIAFSAMPQHYVPAAQNALGSVLRALYEPQLELAYKLQETLYSGEYDKSLKLMEELFESMTEKGHRIEFNRKTRPT